MAIFMSARAVSEYTQKLTGGVGSVLLPFFPSRRPPDHHVRPNDEWWRVEARRGHGPHGPSRRRARSPVQRIRAQPEVGLMANRGRDEPGRQTRGRRSSLKVPRAPFKREAETDLTDTPF